MSICEEDCDFTSYNKLSKKAICSCYTKLSIPLISEIKIDKNKLFSNFKDIRNIGNFKMLSCIRLFFEKKNIFKNLANYMLIILFTLNLISIIAFFLNDISKIKEFINYKEKKNNFKLKNNKNNNIQSNHYQMINFIKKKKNKNNKHKFKKNVQISCNSVRKLKKVSETTNKINLKTELQKYNDYELNSLEYEDALKNDTRTFSKLYISLIKIKHILFFSFFQLKDYNSRTIKILIFFFTFAMNLVVSAMFYSDSTMHKIYIDDGLFDFIYQLPQMFYSFFISTIIQNLLNLFGLYEQDIAHFKKFKNSQEDKRKLISKIKTKIIFFFIINHILLFFFWIYLGCFCAVYKNTQIHLLIDVSSSFSISFITPFIVVLLPSILRSISLKNKTIKRPILFKLSNFLQNL